MIEVSYWIPCPYCEAPSGVVIPLETGQATRYKKTASVACVKCGCRAALKIQVLRMGISPKQRQAYREAMLQESLSMAKLRQDPGCTCNGARYDGACEVLRLPAGRVYIVSKHTSGCPAYGGGASSVVGEER